MNEVMVTKGELVLTPMYNRGRRECEFTPIKYQQSAESIVLIFQNTRNTVRKTQNTQSTRVSDYRNVRRSEQLVLVIWLSDLSDSSGFRSYLSFLDNEFSEIWEGSKP